MKIKSVICLITLMTIVVIHSCTYQKAELPQPALPNNCDTTVSITYTNYLKALIASDCALSGCHDSGAPPGYDYTTYAGIKAKVDNGTFRDRVLVKKDMPSVLSSGPTSLDACTLLKLAKWVNGGAPQ